MGLRVSASGDADMAKVDSTAGRLADFNCPDGKE